MALCLGRTLSQSLGGSASLRERLIFGCASKNSPYVAVHIELLQGNQEDYYVTPLRFSNIGIGRKEILILNGTGDDFVISTMHEGSKRFLRMHPGTGVCKPPNHQVLTEDRAQATHFEAVETLFHGQREYYTLPNYVYFRLKGTQSFLKVHAWEQIGVLPARAVTNGRRGRPNEGHAFKIHYSPW